MNDKIFNLIKKNLNIIFLLMKKKNREKFDHTFIEFLIIFFDWEI